MKRILARLLVLLVSLAVAVLAVEVWARTANPFGINYYADVQRYLRESIDLPPGHPEEFSDQGRIFQNRTEVELVFDDFTYRTDTFGLRRGAAEPVIPADALRLLFLGDSVTLAWGVDDEESWIRTLEREGRAADGRPLVCMNAGHLMYDTVQESYLLSALAPVLEPDVVVLAFIFNDVQPTWGQVEEMLAAGARAQEQSAAPGGITWGGSGVRQSLPGLSALLRFAEERRTLATVDPSTLPPFSFYPDGWPRCEAALDRMLVTCAELGPRFVLMDHTMPPIPELAAWAEANDVDLMTTRFTEEEQAMDIRNSVADSHANALGNRLISDKALAGLRELGVLAP